LTEDAGVAVQHHLAVLDAGDTPTLNTKGSEKAIKGFKPLQILDCGIKKMISRITAPLKGKNSSFRPDRIYSLKID